MTRVEIEAFAARWAASWNAGEVEKVLAHFHDDIVFTSPTAVEVVGTPTVHGKDALRAYWVAALRRSGALHFTVNHVFWDAERREVAIVYTSEIAGRQKRIAEHLRFDARGFVVAAEVFHGVTGPS